MNVTPGSLSCQLLMLRYLLETNLCIRVFRDCPAGLRARFNAEVSSLCISDVVVYELLFGPEQSAQPVENRTGVERFAARLTVLPFDSAAAVNTAEVHATLERRGTPIGSYDIMIASSAHSCELIAVTGNLREFDRVDGLRSEDWLAE